MSALRDAIYGRLSSTSTVISQLATSSSIFHQIAPQDAATPYVLFQKTSGSRDWTFDPGKWINRDLWIVKAVDLSGDAGVAESIDAAIDVALTDAPLTPTGLGVLYLRRETDIDYPEPSGADIYRHVGGVFRVVVAP